MLSFIFDWEKTLVSTISANLKNNGAGHGIGHSVRVRNNAIEISKVEGGEINILVAAAYLHDLFREDKNNTDKVLTIGFAKSTLNQIGFLHEWIDGVIVCIKYHSWSDREKIPVSLPLEALIFQDADRLDAIGAVGIARTFTFGGTRNRPVGVPKNLIHQNLFDGQKFESEVNESTIQHFYDKLLKIRENLNTNTAREIGKKRHDFMMQFLNEFEGEWRMER